MNKLRFHSTDYRKLCSGTEAKAKVNRGFWLWGVPRVAVLCRLFGHKPVVDGTEGIGPSKPWRWVVCDRCGVRPNPQGSLDHEKWNIDDELPNELMPGPWPESLRGSIGGQLIIGKTYPGVSIEAKVGNGASEHVLAAHAKVSPIGALYLHTEFHGQWLQRRLNPKGYNSRTIGVSVHDGRLYWSLWGKRDGRSRDDPKWQRGSVKIDPLERILGAKAAMTRTEQISEDYDDIF